MKNNQRQFVANTACVIHGHVLSTASSLPIQVETDLIDDEFIKAINTARKYNTATHEDKQHLWRIFFQHLELFFEFGGFDTAEHNEQEIAVRVINACFVIEENSCEFTKLFLEHQEKWGVLICKTDGSEHTLH